MELEESTCLTSDYTTKPQSSRQYGIGTRVSFHSNPKERQSQRIHKLSTLALISHTSKVKLKILQARLQQYVNSELIHVQAGFRKAEEPEIKLQTSTGSLKKQESSRKKHLFLLY